MKFSWLSFDQFLLKMLVLLADELQKILGAIINGGK